MTLRPAARLDLRRGESPRRRVDVGRVKDVGGSAVMTDQVSVLFLPLHFTRICSQFDSLPLTSLTHAMTDQADEHQHKIRDTCLLIACHLSCIAPDATETFCNTLRAALRVFPPSAVFVCDNHPYSKDHYGNKTIGPFDRTEEVCDMVSKEFHASEKINYVFIPEGNKSHAMCVARSTSRPPLPRLPSRPPSVPFCGVPYDLLTFHLFHPHHLFCTISSTSLNLPPLPPFVLFHPRRSLRTLAPSLAS